MKMNLPLISVVVTTKNEENNISNCLASIDAQEYPNIEIIVVDNFSTDKTLELAKSYTRHVYQFGPERSAQRNFGLLKVARGQFGMFIDADMILSKRLIKDCVNHFQLERNIIGIYVPEIVLGNRMLHNVRRFERPYYSGTAIDCVRFFSLLECKRIGGFDEVTFNSGSGVFWHAERGLRDVGKVSMLYPKFKVEDVNKNILSIKQVFRNDVEMSCIFHNEEEITFRATLRKKVYYSSAFSSYVKKWGRQDADIKMQFSYFDRLFRIFFQTGGRLRTLRHLHYYLAFLLYKISLGFAVIFFRTITARRSASDTEDRA